MWCLCTWFSVGFAGAGLTFGFDDLGSLFQLKQSWDFVISCQRVQQIQQLTRQEAGDMLEDPNGLSWKNLFRSSNPTQLQHGVKLQDFPGRKDPVYGMLDFPARMLQAPGKS